MTPMVCIAGSGAVTSLGHTAPVTAAAVRANLSGFRATQLVDKSGHAITLARVPVYRDEVTGQDRLLALARPAAEEALAPLVDAAGPNSAAGMPILLGTAPLRSDEDPSMAASLLEDLAIALGAGKHRGRRRVIPLGHASCIAAMSLACERIAAGVDEFVLVGGVDSYYDSDTLASLDARRRLHSPLNPDGFVPGEGAGFVLMASLAAARRYGLEPLALVSSPCCTAEPHPYTSDGVCLGEGLTTAMRQALLAGGADQRRADWTLCDMNGESFRATEWIYAYLRTGRMHADPLELWHPADCLGDMGAASGGVLCGLAIAAWQRNYARGSRAVVWTASDGPERAAVVLHHPAGE